MEFTEPVSSETIQSLLQEAYKISDRNLDTSPVIDGRLWSLQSFRL
jgi:hypothetical protein